jgi:hypothetical protein
MKNKNPAKENNKTRKTLDEQDLKDVTGGVSIPANDGNGEVFISFNMDDDLSPAQYDAICKCPEKMKPPILDVKKDKFEKDLFGD